MAHIILADEYADNSFGKFSQLPPELRIHIWNMAIMEEARERIIIMDVFNPGRFCPTQDLASPFLLVDQESRGCATDYYNSKAKVTRRGSGRASGTVYLRPEHHLFAIDQMGQDLKFGMECRQCFKCLAKIPSSCEAFLHEEVMSRVTSGLLLKQCRRETYVRESCKFLPNLRNVYWLEWPRKPCAIHPSVFLNTLAHLGPTMTTSVFESLGAYWVYCEWQAEPPLENRYES
ncbi:putative 2EXR domain-containing protein [Seiridium cardinale]